MSGIAGIVRFDGTPVDPALVEKMTGAMPYRGPDGIHHWVKGSVALGQCMLRTTPESLEEALPLTNEDESLVLVMDGRVDNWEELREALLARGAVLRTRADAELVLRAYQTWGRDCLAHIDGDFALVLWDAKQREAFCARDRMGNKPFTYHWDGTTLAFASELHPLLALPWVRQRPNEGMLAEFLASEWHSRDETLWQGILRLVAAHRMVVGPAGPRPERYWEPELAATLHYARDEEYVEHYRALVTDSVRRLARSHRPLACEVSGGLDSSAVFAIAEHLRRSGRLPAPSLIGFTFAFADRSAANELGYARMVGEHLGVPIHEVAPTRLPLHSFGERALADQDFPGFPNASMCRGIRRQAALAGARVCLTGEGGDRWLAGSRLYYAEALAQHQWSMARDSFKADLSAFGVWQTLAWVGRYGLFPLLSDPIQDALRRIVRGLRGNRSSDAYWLSPEMHELLQVRRRSSRTGHDAPKPGVGQRELLAGLEDAHWMLVMERLERHGADTGIEARHPLNTPAIAQFAFATPERLRLRGDQTKFVHVQALQHLLPRAILDRRTKAEFSIVFREHLDRLKVELTQAIPGNRPNWITHAGMDRVYQVYQGNLDAGWPLWMLWSLYGCDQLMTRQPASSSDVQKETRHDQTS